MISRQVVYGVALFLVSGVMLMAETVSSPKAALPLRLGDCDEAVASGYVPSGWMGNTRAVEIDECCTDEPYSGGNCIKVRYDGYGDWAGIAWQEPANDWGDEPGGYDLSSATRLTFWARGFNGGERVQFMMGILQSKKKRYQDSDFASMGQLLLSREWQKYEMPLVGMDLSMIKTGFAWTLKGRDEPVIFYLDDIQYE